MYGIQTMALVLHMDHGFENDVKMYGIQTFPVFFLVFPGFENDVKMYGIQTPVIALVLALSLRMM